MKLSFLSHKKHIKKKLHLELDPRKYWVALFSFFVLCITVQLIYFSLLFLKTTKEIDTPPTPVLETNALHIRKITKTLDDVERILESRTGTINTEQDTSLSEETE